MGVMESSWSNAMIPLTAGFVIVASALCVAAAAWNLIPSWFTAKRRAGSEPYSRQDVRTLLRPAIPPVRRAPREG
jgi:hypothetical protein